MLFILIGLFIIVIVGLLSYVFTDTEKCRSAWTMVQERLECALVGITISTVIFGIICCFIWGISYDSYLDLHKYRASFEVRATAISFYSEKGVQEFNVVPGKEVTDLKYHQYQSTVGDLIRDLRNTVEKYNRELVSKRQMKATLFWSWMIFGPDDDMQPVVLSELLKKGKL
jgi:hypothetical protein